jgi:hypothetical protein
MRILTFKKLLSKDRKKGYIKKTMKYTIQGARKTYPIMRLFFFI